MTATSATSANSPPFAPVRPITLIPKARATTVAGNTFLLFPEVEIPKNTSPSFPNPNNCCANTPKPSTSLIYAVVNASCATNGIAINEHSRLFAS